MTPEELYQLLVAILPSVTSVLGIVSAVLGFKKHVKQLQKQSQEQIDNNKADNQTLRIEHATLKEQYMVVMRENAELKQYLKKVLMAIDKVDRGDDNGSSNT